ncbi:MAG: GNAT family N-acetyltransferase [Oscillibacter sp.]|nr:GNAT family N-acetyltransferase [Oscillibacter sp.]
MCYAETEYHRWEGSRLIRKPHASELPEIAEIWLAANLDAHSFIAPACWKGHFAGLVPQLEQAELLVYEDAGGLQGFMGLDGDLIAGLFVRREARGRGIGRALMDEAKGRRERLRLHVYRKNAGALRFYRREGFSVLEEQTDPGTGEAESVMVWHV